MLRRSAVISTIRRHLVVPFAVMAAAALFAGSASADLIVTVQDVTVPSGSTNNALEVTLTNTGGAAVALGGFSFGLSTANTDITFTAADINTSPAYIFAGHSLFGPVISTTPPPNGQVVIASDSYDVPNSGIMLASGATVGLGRVLFDVSPSAAAGVFPVVLTGFPTTSLNDFVGNDVPVTSLKNGSITISSAVPEPASLSLVGFGFATLLVRARRRATRERN
jgi:hypothetical protein